MTQSCYSCNVAQERLTRSQYAIKTYLSDLTGLLDQSNAVKTVLGFIEVFGFIEWFNFLVEGSIP